MGTSFLRKDFWNRLGGQALLMIGERLSWIPSVNHKQTLVHRNDPRDHFSHSLYPASLELLKEGMLKFLSGKFLQKAKQMMGYWVSGRKTKPAWYPRRNAKLTEGISLQEAAARKFTFRWVISMLLGSLSNEDDYDSIEDVAKRMRFASFQTSSRLFGPAQRVNRRRFLLELNS